MIQHISLQHYLVVALLLFLIGFSSLVMNKRSLIDILMAIELMFLGVNLSLVGASSCMNNVEGQVFTVFIICAAAAETALALAIFTLYIRKSKTAELDEMTEAKG